MRAFDDIVNHDKISEHADSLLVFKDLDFRGKHLLLVEDNALNREIAVEIIKMTGIDIDTAGDGEQAVRMFNDSDYNHYDLILMDIQMPVMNGFDATMMIRALNRPDAKSVPIVAMTADAFVEDVEKALAAQMNEHIAKPLDMQKLADVMNRWISKL